MGYASSGAGDGAQTTKNIFSDNQAKSGGAYHSNINGVPANDLKNNSFLRNTSSNETLFLDETNFENNLVAYNQTTGAPNILLGTAGSQTE